MTSGPASKRSAPMPNLTARTTEIRWIAAKLFETNGYSNTTISQIAEAVGILPGSLYNHFTSKEEIGVDLLTEFYRELSEVSADARVRQAQTEVSPETHILQLATTLIDLAQRHAAAVRLRSYAAPSVATKRSAHP